MKLRDVPAGIGLQWVGLGMRTFLRQPLALAGLFFMFMATVSVLSVIPLLGTLLAAVLTPAANFGLMAASREAANGRFPMPAILISGLRAGPAQTRSMLILGGLYAGSLLIVLTLAMLLGPDAVPMEADGTVTPDAMRALLGSPGLWLAMLLYVPISMMFWHAPALVHWHAVPPVKSLFFSLLACWQNRGALLLFGIGWMGVFLAFGLMMSLLSALFGESMGFILYPAVLMVASMFYASVYFTFRDSFDDASDSGGTAVFEALPDDDRD